MARSWLLDSRGLAKKVINAGRPAAYQIKDCGANTQCPNCHSIIDNSNAHEWPGFPAGVKFDPSDVELLDHLAAKRGVGISEQHLFIDEFIPTLDCEGGICYTHPENLPGAKKDGSSVHFFHKINNAYASGKRKRRRIQDEESMVKTYVRWHKTGKTKRVMENGIHKGFKKIMVLYGTSKPKPDKCNWVMHQYHLGTDEEEEEGEFVVSKIFHQREKETVAVIPMTPKTTTPDPPRQDKTPSSDCLSVDYFLESLLQMEHVKDPYYASYGSRLENDEYTTRLDTITEAAVDSFRADSLLCHEIIEPYADFGDLGPNFPSSTQVNGAKAITGIGELDNLELDTPPDFHTDLQFPSQDSVFDLYDLQLL